MVPKDFNPQFFLGEMFKGQIHQFHVSKAVRYKVPFSIGERFKSDDKTLLLYRFDEGQGDKLTDLSGNGHHGKIVGAKWVKVDGPPTLIAKAPGPWQPLLDAKLAQWWITDNKQPDAFTVAALDGEPSLRLKHTAKPAHLASKRWDIKNNHLRLDFQFTGTEAGGLNAAYSWGENGRSGIQFRIANDGKTRGYFYSARCAEAYLERGVIVSKGNIKGPDVIFAAASLNPVGAWNRLELVRLEDRVALFVNGRFMGALAEIRDLWDGKEAEVGSTWITLQGVGGEVLIRRIEIRDISALPPELLAPRSLFPPLDPAWLKAVAAMKAEQQIEAVKTELVKRNPGFGGDLEAKVGKDGVVTELRFSTDNVGDISPLRALQGLQKLTCNGTFPDGGKLGDLSPLKNMPLTFLYCPANPISDLAPLSGMKLTHLWVHYTPVADLSPVKDMKLKLLN